MHVWVCQNTLSLNRIAVIFIEEENESICYNERFCFFM